MEKIFSVLILIFIGILFRLFVGVYTNDEFGGNHLFIKHRPTWQGHFYSPVGLSDMTMKDLTDEQKYWDEFVVGQFKIV